MIVGAVYRSFGVGSPSAGWVAVLNSRQGRYPQRGEEWVQATVSAVRGAAHRGKGVVTSVGLHTWELSLWTAGDCGVPAVVVVPAQEGNLEETRDRISEDFSIQPGLLTLFFLSSHSAIRPKGRWPERDRVVITVADELWPISVRPGGNVDSLIRQSQREGKPISDEFRVAYRPTRGSGVRKIDLDRLAPWTRRVDWPFLTHWTHSFDKPWPGERPAEYYRCLSQKGTGNPRSARETLSRILKEGCLRGSSFKMPGKQRAVAFTDLPPALAMEQMRYRKRFQRWSFEPYGMALDRTKLSRLGTCAVVYGGDPSAEEAIFIQGQRSGKADWSGQREWRFPGDLDLPQFESSEALILVRDPDDPKRFKGISRWPVLALTERRPDEISSTNGSILLGG